MFRLFSKGLPLIFSISSIVLLVIFYLFIQMYSAMHTDIALTDEETIVFTRGSTIRTLANQLVEEGMLKDKLYFLAWGKLKRQSTRLQAGEYRLVPGASLGDLLDNMVAGKVVQHNITLIEGSTFSQMMQVIQENPVIIYTALPTTRLNARALLPFRGH